MRIQIYNPTKISTGKLLESPNLNQNLEMEKRGMKVQNEKHYGG